MYVLCRLYFVSAMELLAIPTHLLALLLYHFWSLKILVIPYPLGLWIYHFWLLEITKETQMIKRQRNGEGM